MLCISQKILQPYYEVSISHFKMKKGEFIGREFGIKCRKCKLIQEEMGCSVK